MTPRERAKEFCRETGADEVVRIDDIEQLIKDAVEDALDTSCAAGKEAEELRDRIGALVDAHENDDLETRIRNLLDGCDLSAEIREVLDDVDARDANQWLVHKARVEKLEDIVGTITHTPEACPLIGIETSDGLPIVAAARALMGHRGPRDTIPASASPSEVRVASSLPSPRSRTE